VCRCVRGCVNLRFMDASCVYSLDKCENIPKLCDKFIVMHGWLSEQFTGMLMVCGFVEFCSVTFCPGFSMLLLIGLRGFNTLHIAYDAYLCERYGLLILHIIICFKRLVKSVLLKNIWRLQYWEVRKIFTFALYFFLFFLCSPILREYQRRKN